MKFLPGLIQTQCSHPCIKPRVYSAQKSGQNHISFRAQSTHIHDLRHIRHLSLAFFMVGASFHPADIASATAASAKRQPPRSSTAAPTLALLDKTRNVRRDIIFCTLQRRKGKYCSNRSSQGRSPLRARVLHISRTQEGAPLTYFRREPKDGTS